VAASGDAELPALLPFFECYRAVVRGKVESLRLDDPGFDAAARAAAAERARRFFALALERAGAAPRPTLLVVAGRSGTGKSTLAQAVAARLGWPVVSSDVVRKALAGLPPEERRPAALGEGLYAPEMTRRTYAALREGAAAELAAGRSVVLDATFLDRDERATVRRLAEQHGARFVLVDCVAAPEAVRARLAARAREGRGASDAGWEVYQAQAEAAASLREEPGRVAVDTTESVERQVARVLGALGG
jgi:hypothetical protein